MTSKTRCAFPTPAYAPAKSPPGPQEKQRHDIHVRHTDHISIQTKRGKSAASHPSDARQAQAELCLVLV